MSQGRVMTTVSEGQRALSPLPARYLLLILISAGAMHACGLWRPFVDRHDWGTAHQAQFGRNHVRYGLGVTRTRCMYSAFQQRISEARKFYPDHPPLLSLSLALSIAIFGDNEVGVRMVPAAATVAAIGLVASIAAGLGGRRYALWSAAVMLAMPILLYFGRTATHEQLVLGFWLLALRGYLGWTWPDRFGSRANRDALLFAIGTVLSILSGWVGLLQAGVIWLHYAVCVLRKHRNGTSAGWLLVTAPAAIAALGTFTHILWTLEWKSEHLVQLFFYRSGIKEGEKPFTMAAWLVQQAEWLRRDYTISGVAMALIACAIPVGWHFGRLARSNGTNPAPKGRRRVQFENAGGEERKRAGEAKSLKMGIGPGLYESAWLVGAAGLMYVLLFRGASFIHEYWWMHFTPAMALAIAAVPEQLMRIFERRVFVLAAMTPIPLLVMSLQSASDKEFFHHRRRIAAIAMEPCQFINEHAPADAVIYGNRQFWAIREYHEGPLRFLHPQISWYLDRMYVKATEEEALARLAPQCGFYLWLKVRREDIAVGERLRRMGTVLAEWPDAMVVDLTKKR